MRSSINTCYNYSRRLIEERIMRNITLGSTGITVHQNAFGALPIQRDSVEVPAVRNVHIH